MASPTSTFATAWGSEVWDDMIQSPPPTSPVYALGLPAQRSGGYAAIVPLGLFRPVEVLEYGPRVPRRTDHHQHLAGVRLRKVLAKT